MNDKVWMYLIRTVAAIALFALTACAGNGISNSGTPAQASPMKVTVNGSLETGVAKTASKSVDAVTGSYGSVTAVDAMTGAVISSTPADIIGGQFSLSFNLSGAQSMIVLVAKLNSDATCRYLAPIDFTNAPAPNSLSIQYGVNVVLGSSSDDIVKSVSTDLGLASGSILGNAAIKIPTGKTFGDAKTSVIKFGGLCIAYGPDGALQPSSAFTGGNLIVSRTVYAGTAATVTIGQALPGGGTATVDGSFPNVFKNEVPDPSFGITSPIYLDQIATDGSLVSMRAIDTGLITSSFASKSELALNVSTDGTAVTFMGYKAGVNQLDVSNANTPGVFDATNPVQTTFQRAVAQVNLKSGGLTVAGVNAYSGNNGRAVVLANGTYYMVGNAGNGNGDGNSLSALSDNTGVQSISARMLSTGNTSAIGLVLGTFGSSTGYQRGFSLAQLADLANPGKNYAADKTGKDNNFRGLTVFNNTLYVTKGSGSNGVNSVYQVGPAGALSNGGTIPGDSVISILPGFNALSEKVAEAKATLTATPHPFGIWFADANTLFVADEGDGVRVGVSGKVTTFAGLAEYKLVGGNWTKVATFQSGLLDQSLYSAGMPWNIKTDGLRNISGKVNADGSVTIYATTATVSDELTHDLGADPNQLVSITINANSTPANTSFKVLRTAASGERFGGVTMVP